jgi:hypothetical protein
LINEIFRDFSLNEMNSPEELTNQFRREIRRNRVCRIRRRRTNDARYGGSKIEGRVSRKHQHEPSRVLRCTKDANIQAVRAAVGVCEAGYRKTNQ